jgi:HicB family
MTESTKKAARPRPKQFNIRLRPGMHERLQGRSWATGVSLNTVANDMLEAGFNAERTIENAFGAVAVFKIMQTLANAAETVAVRHGADQGRWLWDEKVFNDAAAAIMKTLEALRPNPEVRAVLVELEADRKVRARG